MRHTIAAQTRPVRISTTGYLTEMCTPQLRHLARRIRKEARGMLSYHAIGCSQPGQREPGETTEKPRGTRKTATLAKLPNATPKTNATASSSGFKAAAELRGRPPTWLRGGRSGR